MLDKDIIKNKLTVENIEELLVEMGGSPIRRNEALVCKTICHGGNSHKLYYYFNTRLFKCFTDCEGQAFDIFDLLCRVKNREGLDFTLPDAMYYVCNKFNLYEEAETFENKENFLLPDWQVINKYKKLKNNNKITQIVELKTYNGEFLKNLPTPRILPWEEDGITTEVMKRRNICYNPITQGIVIPHYDMNGHLVGIRERTLIKEQEVYGKYKPAIFGRQMYNHPLGFNLYNLNFSKENIKRIEKAVILEGEKGCLQYASFFGIDNDISVATCGSSLLKYQVELLIQCGAKELCIAFDRQYKDVNSEEGKKWIRKLKDIHKNYSPYVQISFLFDKQNLLPYKASPTDEGEEVFKKLFKERIFL